MVNRGYRNDPDDDHLIAEAKKIVGSLGKMFAPFCEVLLHDLRRPESSILAIENPLSGRKVGESATLFGLARITQADFPDVVQNYANVLPDGRRVKSTSIGIRARSGRFIASLCLNMDISHFADLSSLVERLIAVDANAPAIREELRTLTRNEIQKAIAEFSAEHNTVPKRLKLEEKRALVARLQERGLLEVKNAVPVIAYSLGVTRPSVYNYLRARAPRA